MTATRDVHGRKQEEEARNKGRRRKEGHAGAVQSQRGFRCRGNPSAVCVASAQQCASDSPVPVNTDSAHQ